MTKWAQTFYYFDLIALTALKRKDTICVVYPTFPHKEDKEMEKLKSGMSGAAVNLSKYNLLTPIFQNAVINCYKTAGSKAAGLFHIYAVIINDELLPSIINVELLASNLILAE